MNKVQLLQHTFLLYAQHYLNAACHEVKYLKVSGIMVVDVHQRFLPVPHQCGLHSGYQNKILLILLGYDTIFGWISFRISESTTLTASKIINMNF
jgi:hypothetical protein